jgi:hypothetical protein
MPSIMPSTILGILASDKTDFAEPARAAIILATGVLRHALSADS